MKAILLAAGRGSRMRSLTDDRPKCLMELRGRTLLDWQLSALREAGINEIGIVTGYRAEMLQRSDLTIFNNPRWAQTNMVSSLAAASDWLASDTCIVSYSDIFYQASAVASLMQSTDALAITYDPGWQALWQQRFGNPLLDAETFRLNPDGTLAGIGQKPQSLDEVEGQYMGLLRFTPAAWACVVDLRARLSVEDQDTMHMTGTLSGLLAAGSVPIAAIPYSGEWGEVDSAEDLALYRGTK